MSIELIVNGQTVNVAVADDTPLLDVLRNHLDLKGSRYGCGLEQCGSCMVVIDGEAEYSCAREAGSVVGRRIETVESLTSHPLRQAFLDEQAGQCGYCLSGIMMSAKALLDRNRSPTRAEIVTALDVNLCRCGAHPRILRAVEKAAAVLRESAPEPAREGARGQTGEGVRGHAGEGVAA
jgi:nicotinate dehydrogenase subunit A